ncbi:MAG: hypothetical protein NVSMB18_07080 [Acetobacteraceae bacterium]
MQRLLLLPLLALPVLALVFLAPGGLQASSWLRMAELLRDLQGFALTDPLAAAGLYTLLYIAMIVCCIPLAPAMGVGGGAILGAPLGAICAVVGATIGSVIMLLLSRSVLGPSLPPAQRAMIDRLRPRLERNGFTLLFTMRLAVVMPGWLLNFAAGLAGMRIAPFAAATALGVVPAMVVFASLGASLGEVLSGPTPPGLGLLARPSVLLPLLALSAMALVPLLVQRGGALLRERRRA